jgi:hypothetical protein
MISSQASNIKLILHDNKPAKKSATQKSSEQRAKAARESAHAVAQAASAAAQAATQAEEDLEANGGVAPPLRKISMRETFRNSIVAVVQRIKDKKEFEG